MFWSYVQGMLKNFTSLPVDRIHKMLTLFMIHDPDVQVMNENMQRCRVQVS